MNINFCLILPNIINKIFKLLIFIFIFFLILIGTPLPQNAASKKTLKYLLFSI